VQRSSPFRHGDALVLFTDGIIEACDPRGDQFGLARVRAALTRAEAPASWPEYIVRMAREHSRGVPGDDMLVVEVRAPAPAPVERVPEQPALAATA
jgi:serine phosphatase RsbU (regulator of sigma subunit)